MEKKTMGDGEAVRICSWSLFKGALAASVSVFMLLLCGCATKEMKSTPFYEGNDISYTGKPEDRINVWPVAYWREPVGSVLWPLTSFSDDQFALRPIYSQYRQDGKDGRFDEFNFLWPFCQADLKGDGYRIFPFFWGTDAHHHAYQTIFPVYWNGRGYNSLFPLWIYRDSGASTHLSVLSGMVGGSSETNGCSANWCFPLWYWNSRGTFVTTIYGRWKNGWAVPPLLSFGTKEDNGNYLDFYLLGWGGAMRYGRAGYMWAAPFFNREWRECDSSNRISKTHVMLNLAGWESRNDELASSYLFPLYSWYDDTSLLTPLFYYNTNGSLLTPLGGKTVNDGTTNTFATLLVRHATGKKNGGTVFPLWNHTVYHDFQEKAGKFGREQLPDDIRIWNSITTNMTWNKKKTAKDIPVVSTNLNATSMSAKDDTEWLLLFPWHDKVAGCLSCDNTYKMARTIKRGNDILLKYDYERTARYSTIDRNKKSDDEESRLSFLIWLYGYRHEKDIMKNDEYTQHRVLWRLWDWEEQNGNVSLDVFPGFTYDAKTDGFSKTSFLWRFFRYERDPGKGTAVDCLFIPVWR